MLWTEVKMSTSTTRLAARGSMTAKMLVRSLGNTSRRLSELWMTMPHSLAVSMSRTPADKVKQL